MASIFLSTRRPSAIYAQRDVASKIPLLCRAAGRLLPCLDAPLRRALDAVFGISDPNIWVRPAPPSSPVHARRRSPPSPCLRTPCLPPPRFPFPRHPSPPLPFFTSPLLYTPP